LLALAPKDWMPAFEPLTPWLSFASWLFELDFALGLVMLYWAISGGWFAARLLKAFIPGL